MKYSLLNYICCSTCGGDLTCIIPLPGEVPKDDAIEIEGGLLACNACACSRWFPIRNFIPELLPDHLRNWEKDLEFLKTWEPKLPATIFKELWEQSQTFANRSVSVEDHGFAYKEAEISIKSKVTDEGFFGPGFSSPFNPGNPNYTVELIRRLGNVLPLLELKQGDIALDIGVGYAWTTEWLMKMGVVAIGVDICRTYLDIGVQRMGKTLPYLVIGDIENLPVKNNCLDAVLCYDAFHHIPDRKKSIGHFHRALKNRGKIVLAEPGGMHEYAKVSTEVMNKYGILEKGMELDDINMYCAGLNVLPPEQHFVLEIKGDEMGQTLSREFVYSHPYVDCNIFVVKKQADDPGVILRAPTLKKKIKTKIRRLLERVFFKPAG